MKRKIAAALCVGFLLFFLFGFGAYAEGKAESAAMHEVDTSQWWASLRDALPDGAAADMNEVAEGDTAPGFEYLFSILLREVRGEGSHFLGMLASVIGVTVLGSVAGILSEDTALAKPLGLVCSVSVTLVLCQSVSSSLVRAAGYLTDLSNFATALTPVMAAVLSGGGATGGAAVAAGSMTTLFTVLEVVVGQVLAPLISTLFAFALVGSISEGVHVDGIASNIKSLYMTVLGAVGMLATGAVTLQSVLASSTDTMAMRTARYTVGNMIPIVGGTIGATLGTLGSSLTVIKSSIGVGALVACLSLTLPILLSLYFTRLSLSLSASVARLMGNRRGERLLNDFRGVFDMTLAVTALSGVLFLIQIAVFLKTALPFAQ